MMKMGTVEMEVPTNNTIAIRMVSLDEAIEKASRMHKRSFTYEEYFDMYHTLVTKEDREQIDKSLDKKAEEDKNFDAQTAKKLLDAVKTENFTDVENLGDKANLYVQAAAGIRTTQLSVLHDNVVVLISVDISDDDAEDSDAAKAIARDVVDLCS
jgi:hypothetical protein